jgi:hypothetical protein
MESISGKDIVAMDSPPPFISSQLRYAPPHPDTVYQLWSRFDCITFELAHHIFTHWQCPQFAALHQNSIQSLYQSLAVHCETGRVWISAIQVRKHEIPNINGWIYGG